MIIYIRVIFSTSSNASTITQVLVPKSDYNNNNNIYIYIYIHQICLHSNQFIVVLITA